MERNERASQRSGSLAALQWNGMETAGMDGVRQPPRRQSAVLKRRPSPLARVTGAAKLQSDAGVKLLLKKGGHYWPPKWVSTYCPDGVLSILYRPDEVASSPLAVCELVKTTVATTVNRKIGNNIWFFICPPVWVVGLF